MKAKIKRELSFSSHATVSMEKGMARTFNDKKSRYYFFFSFSKWYSFLRREITFLPFLRTGI